MTLHILWLRGVAGVPTLTMTFDRKPGQYLDSERGRRLSDLIPITEFEAKLPLAWLGILYPPRGRNNIDTLYRLHNEVKTSSEERGGEARRQFLDMIDTMQTPINETSKPGGGQ